MGHLQNIDQGQCLPTCERQARPLLTLRSDDGGKSIYEAMHPETKQHVAGGKAGGRGRPKDIATDNVAVANFADDASTKTGKSARTVRKLRSHPLARAANGMDKTAVSFTSVVTRGDDGRN